MLKGAWKRTFGVANCCTVDASHDARENAREQARPVFAFVAHGRATWQDSVEFVAGV
jgi:hypothetical protein